MSTRLEAALAALAGGALDLGRLDADIEANAQLVRELERLWDLPVGMTHCASVFSASWEGFSTGG